ECVGLPGPDADVEVIELAIRTLESVGLARFHVELAQVELGRVALEVVPAAARELIVEALARKDETALEAALATAGVDAGDRKPLLALVSLYGGPSEVLDRARRSLHAPEMQRALDALERIVERLEAIGLGHRIGVDLGELRGQSYYTGTSFTVLADGPGEPLGAGGRYDNLLSAFGAPAPATGFALDVDNVDWALRAAGIPAEDSRPLRVVFLEKIAGGAEVIGRLRGEGFHVARLPDTSAAEAAAFARAWGYDVVVHGTRARLDAVRLSDETNQTFTLLDGESPKALASWAAARFAADATPGEK
ncbi:MAG: ATP phosphoribosyltransferase regulatory subunit, partial [Polyangiaceae bacterium]|nr:ATP phosphoribosyltransferase regulatory subunit [Polyangiaceae bacterium]